MEPILLPKGYLSPSQMEMWEKSPDRYMREYFEKGRRLVTKYTEFGNVVHKLIEDGLHEIHLPGLKVYDVPEMEIRIDVRGVPTLGRLDGYDETENCFGDYKTGKAAWTQAKVQKHRQFTFYATQVRIIKGIAPRYCDVHWIETLEEDPPEHTFWKDEPKMRLTGKVRTFRRYFDERELDRMEHDIERVAREISSAYRKFISEL